MSGGYLTTHNRTWSVISLARTMLQAIDDTKTHQTVQTESLKLVLDTLIGAGRDDPAQKMNEEVRRKVEEMVAPPILDERGGSDRGWL